MAKRKASKGKPEDPVAQQLEQVKRLLMLQMIVSGVQANQIAKVLGVSKSVISGIVPARMIKKRAGVTNG